MLFNSLAFLVFAAIYFPVHFLLHGNWRLAWALAASYVFYGWWDWRFLPLIAFSTGVNYISGLLLDRSDPRRRRPVLSGTIILNIGLLAVFKYYDFFVDSTREALALFSLQVSPGLLELALPIGISFYTFHGLSYVIDIYRGICRVERNPIRFAAYIALFPQLVAGPIVRASKMLPQMMSDARLDWARIVGGLELVAIGFALKLVVADNLAPFVDAKFADIPGSSAAALALASIFFAFQIYGDFGGYSLIAIGLGRILGYDFGENFRRPYFATSFSDFWQRWHISLSSWLRDYLYIPLGGNRHGTSKTARNLVIVMFLGGLWHGASWTFVVWGLLHGAYLVMQRAVERLGGGSSLASSWPTTVLKILVVFLLVCIAWIFFRAQSISDAWTILSRIATGEAGAAGLSAERLTVARNITIILGLVAIEASVEYCSTRPAIALPRLARPAFVLAILWTIAAFGAFEGSEFVYFQF